MRLWLGMLGTAVVAAIAPAAASSAHAAPTAPPVKTCHKGYGVLQKDKTWKAAVFSWGQRCVRSGQYCKKVRNPEYHKYNFQCVNGQLRKQTGKKNGS